jgi:hypothetical protein
MQGLLICGSYVGVSAEVLPLLRRKSLASPATMEPDQLRLDHISDPLDLFIEGPFQDAVIAILAPGRTLEEAATIWAVWEPDIQPPLTHPLTTGTQARDTVLAMLCMEYNMTENAEVDCLAHLDFIVASILHETLTAQTAVTLTEEEMAVVLHPFAYLSSLYITIRLLITGALATILSLI